MHPLHRGFESDEAYRQDLLRYGVAFVLITALCFAVTLISAEVIKWPPYLAGWGLATGCVALAWFRPSLWLLAPFGALGGAILVRSGTDGLDAGLGPLLLIPILAISLYGSRRALLAMLICLGTAVIVAHIVSADDAIEMTSTWRQDIVLVVMATVLGVVIQDLVTRMRNERNLAEERGRIIEELALTDPLTGIDNRRGWERMIQRSIGQARRHPQPLSLAMLDLDQFKEYNDAHGHQAGDDFLREIAQDWEAKSRIDDHIARYGGDEFVITLPNTDLDGAQAIVERLRNDPPQPSNGPGARITCSAGIAQWDGSETVRELLARADRALYAAKEGGRDRTVAVETPEPASGLPS